MTTALQHHREEFAERNLLLHLALGLHARGLEARRLVERHAPPLHPPAGGVDATSVDPHDAALADFVLGLLATHGRLATLIAAAQGPAPERRPHVTVTRARELLR